MSDLEELKKRKEQLLLEQEVAKLERKQKFDAMGKWNWGWVAPLSVIGLFFLFQALDSRSYSTPYALYFLAFFSLAPLALKLYFKR